MYLFMYAEDVGRGLAGELYLENNWNFKPV